MSARCLSIFVVIVPKSTLGGDVCCILTLKLRSYNKHDKLKKYFGNENANVQWENCAKQWRHNVGFDQACMVTAAALVQWDRGSTGSSIQSGQYDRMRVTLTQHTASAWPVMGPRLSALPCRGPGRHRAVWPRVITLGPARDRTGLHRTGQQSIYAALEMIRVTR